MLRSSTKPRSSKLLGTLPNNANGLNFVSFFRSISPLKIIPKHGQILLYQFWAIPDWSSRFLCANLSSWFGSSETGKYILSRWYEFDEFCIMWTIREDIAGDKKWSKFTVRIWRYWWLKVMYLAPLYPVWASVFPACNHYPSDEIHAQNRTTG